MQLQEFIHKFEVGEGTRAVKWVAAVLGLAALVTVYDLRAYRNFSTPEAMDAAQLARNLAGGNGFTTDFIRPFSLHLQDRATGPADRPGGDAAPIKGRHPDLSNPPLYPLALAGLMKVFPFDYGIPSGSNFIFQRYQPEVWIGLFNQFLFLVALILVFRLARRLFDAGVAWVTVLVLAGTELFWKLSVSGLSTMLLLVIFLGLVSCLVITEQAAREGTRGGRWLTAMALLIGVLAGLAGLTRYSFVFLIIPVLVFLASYFEGRRVALCVVATLGFLVVLTPWMVRNVRLSGVPFGTATYAVVQGTARFPGDQLQRSLKPDLSQVSIMSCLRKGATGLREILQTDLPRLGGNWITAFFLAGLLVPFTRVGLGRLRVFLLLCLALASVVQALGRTPTAPGASEVSQQNLLVILAPLVFVYGVGIYSLLLGQIEVPFAPLRNLLTGFAVILVSGPLIFALIQRTHPLAFPPYYPPLIQRFAAWMKPDELVMSDMPWAVAWYGRKQSIWISLSVSDPKTGDDFFSINDLRKPIKGLYLTHFTLDQKFHSEMLLPQGNGWGRFVTDAVASTNLPPGFPLKESPSGYLRHGQLFLTDWQRWPRRTE